MRVRGIMCSPGAMTGVRLFSMTAASACFWSPWESCLPAMRLKLITLPNGQSFFYIENNIKNGWEG